MNKRCYRIIFNRERGMLMVVSEIAKSQGGAERGSVIHHDIKPSLLAKLRLLSLLTALALGATLFLNPAQAKIVADASAPGKQQPQVSQSSNGTPQVNIQTPSAGGVSKNKYSQFDVDQKGVILNNSRNPVKTELGGYVAGNNNLAAGEARIILNEVNSRNPSHLNGYIEVAGKKAQVIIANPSGITCDGCGFINADRATLTTGQVLMENGHVTGYNVQKGSVKIAGKGLDSSRQDYTEIIARSAEVNAGIWANDLNVVTGRNTVNKDLTSITPHSGNSDDKPEFAIDVAHLGGMYANKIHLIGTEQGVGVRNAGKLGAQAGSVVISANGRIENSGTIQSRDALTITATAHLNNSGKLSSAEKSINVKATSHINNSGDILSKQNVELTSQQSSVTNSKNIAAQTGKVTLQAAQQIENSKGHIQSEQDLTLTSRNYIKNSGNLVSTEGHIKTNGKEQFTNSGNIQAAQTLTIYSDSNIVNSGNIVAQNGTLSLTTKGYLESSNGHIQGYGDLNFIADRYISNLGGNILSNNGAIAFSSGEYFVNSGNIQSQLSLSVTAPQYMTNSGNIVSKNSGIQLNTLGYFDNNNGHIQSQQALLIESGQSVGNSGNLLSTESAIDIKAKESINNLGNIQSANAMNIHSGSSLTNNSNIISQNDAVTITANQVTNTKVIQAQQNLAINSSTTIVNIGQLFSELASILLKGVGALTNSGAIKANNDITLFNTDTILNSGTMYATQHIDLQSAKLTNQGTLAAKGNLIINTGLFESVTNSLTAGGLRLDGKLQGTSQLTITASNANVSGNLLSSDVLTLNSDSLTISKNGEIAGEKTYLIVANELSNRGLIDGGLTRIETTTLNNLGTGRIYGDTLAIQSTTLNNLAENGLASTLAARYHMSLAFDTLNNRDHGLIYSGRSLTIGRYLDNTNNTTGRAGTINNHSSTIEADGDAKIVVNRLNNINDNFATEIREVGRENYHEYRMAGTTERWRPEEVRLHHDEVMHITLPGGRWNDEFYEYQYERVIEESVITKTDPAKILTGGNLVIDANYILNDKSQIVAGKGLNIIAGVLNNIEVPGLRYITDTGTVIRWYRIKKSGSDRQGKSYSDYIPAVVQQQITLKPSTVEQHTSVQGSNPNLGNHDKSGSNIDIADNNIVVTEKGVIVTDNSQNITLPDNNLFVIHPGPGSNYLVESDPRFTNYKNWLGSDYLIKLLKSDPNNVMKRLGDGYYEQKLIRDQITNLLGVRYLDGFSNDEEQYKALMNAGAEFAGKYNLSLGVALTAEQMSQLTSDIVWMVSKEVTLADGSKETVLVPQVYAKAASTNIDGSGALISGQQVGLQVSGDMTNSGRVIGSDKLTILTENLHNIGGSLAASDLQIAAKNDINNIGGLIQADNNLILHAGNDINITTTTKDNAHSSGKNSAGNTTIHRVGSVVVNNDKGSLLLDAGNDINLQAAHIVANGEDSQISLSAGNDINLTTVKTSQNESINFDKDNYYNLAQSQDIGSEIVGVGNISLSAKNDINATAAQVNAGDKLQVSAGNDINILAGESHVQMDEHSKIKGKSGGVSKLTTERHTYIDNQYAESSILSGDTVSLNAGNDMTIQGSDVTSTHDLSLKAGNKLTITTATETQNETHIKQEKKSGLMSSGGIGFTVGMIDEKSTQNVDATKHLGSIIGSTEGNVTIVAGNDLAIKGSDVIAQNDITLAGKNVTIESVENQTTVEDIYERKQSGLTVGLSGVAGSAIDSAYRSAQAAQEANSSQIKALQEIKAALSVVQAAQSVQLEAPDGQGYVGVSVSVGTQVTKSETITNQTVSQGSSITAGNNLVITATGSGERGVDGDINIKGSAINAGNNLTLDANRDINIIASADSQKTESENKSYGGNVGISIGWGGGKNGVRVFGDANFAQGSTNADGIYWNESIVNAGNKLTVNSGRDTNVIGGQLSGDSVNMDVGGDLNLVSLQDTDDFDYKQTSVSINGSYGSGFDVGFSFTQDKMDSEYASVQEQTGIFAGSGGYDIRVDGNTDLKGAVIESQADAGKNVLDTGTISFSDIENKAEFDVSHVSISVGSGGSGPAAFVPGVPVVITNNEKDSSITHSAISDGTIIIRDKDNQVQDIDDLSRDTENANNVLEAIFDREKEQERLDSLQLVGQVGQQLTSIVKTQGKINAENAAKEALMAENGGREPTPQEIKDSQVYKDTLKQYEPGGDYHQIAQSVNGIVQGIVGGNYGAAVGNALAPHLAEAVKHATKDLTGDKDLDRVANALGHAVAGALVAQAGGNNALAGATGAASGELIAQIITEQLYGKKPEELSDIEKEVVTNLSTIAAGVAGGIASDSTAGMGTGAAAGQNAVENNMMNPNGSFQQGVIDYAGANKAIVDAAQKEGLSQEELKLVLIAAGLVPKPDDLPEEARKVINLLYEQIIPGISNERALADAIKSGNPEDLVYAILPILKGINSIAPNPLDTGKGTVGQIVKNKDGINEVTIDKTPLDAHDRLNTPDLGGSGKLKPAEAASAAQLEPSLGTMERYTPPPGAVTDKTPDFVITSGPNKGKTVDAMYTTDKLTQKEIDGLNKYYEKNMNSGAGQKVIQDHLNKADYVPVDFRVLTPANQKIFMSYVKTLPKSQQDKIIIMR